MPVVPLGRILGYVEDPGCQFCKLRKRFRDYPAPCRSYDFVYQNSSAVLEFDPLQHGGHAFLIVGVKSERRSLLR